jgi:hypothetical protein
MPEEIKVDPPEEAPVTPTLEEVVAVPVADLDDTQKDVIRANADDLTDEQKETFKDVLEEKKDDDQPINPDEIEPEVRGGKPKVEKPKKDKKEIEEEEPEDEDDEITPEDEKLISKIVDKRVGGALKEVQVIKDQTDVDAFIRAKPEYGKYREVALKYMVHPAYQNVPVSNIMAIVAQKDLEKIGAQKERDAAKKAKDTQNPGGSVREPGKGKTDWGKASKEDFEAQRAKVFGQH